MRSVMIIGAGLLLTGCMKEELPVPRAPRGDARTVQYCLGPGYQQQLWIDLNSATVVRENPISAWDLVFESGPDGWRIQLNGGRLMLAWNTGATSIQAPVDAGAVTFSGSIDAPTGHPDSTAFGDWRGSSPLYVVDMGYDSEGNALGQRRIRPLAVSADGYTIEVAMADGSDATIMTVPKDPQRTWVYFKFGQGAVDVAPPNGQWDIVLTRYTHIFRDIDLPYLVVGALIDGRTTRVSRMSGVNFDLMQLADTMQFPFMDQRDIIGYDWKEYSFETSAYTCAPDLVYILRDAAGSFHKLKFLDFYGAQGQLGCPVFSVAQF